MLIWESHSRSGSWTAEDEARLQAILAGIDAKPGVFESYWEMFGTVMTLVLVVSGVLVAGIQVWRWCR